MSARFADLTEKRPRSLRREAEIAGVPYVIALDVHRLPFLSTATRKRLARDLRTPLGQMIEYPMTPETFATPEAVDAFARTAIAVQDGALFSAAPDFMFTTADDPWLDVNLRMLRACMLIRGRQEIVAWIHVTLDTVRDGTLASVAGRYAAVLPPGSRVVIAVNNIEPRLPIDANDAYFKALLAFDSVGLVAVTDRAGEASIPAAGTVAGGYMLGPYQYRTVSSPPFDPVPPNAPKLRYWDGRGARRVSRDDAQRWLAARTVLIPCPHPQCRALRPASTEAEANLALRLHNAHAVRLEVRRLRDLGIEPAIRWMARQRLVHQRRWAAALDSAIAASEAA